jgi:hypothetical protein
MSTILKDEAIDVIAHAYNHAREKLPGLDRESFLNGFLYGFQFASKYPGYARDIDVRTLYEPDKGQ